MTHHPRTLRLIAAVLLVWLLTACASLHQEGMQAYRAGNVPLAEQKLQAAIRGGDTEAWNTLGAIYDRTGRRDQAIRAYQMGARYGDPTAQQNLIQKGLPVPPADLRKAEAPTSPIMLEMLRQSAARNQPSAPASPRFCDSKAGLGGSVSTTCY